MYAIIQIATISFLLPSLLSFSFLLPTFILCVTLSLSFFVSFSLSLFSLFHLYLCDITLQAGYCSLLRKVLPSGQPSSRGAASSALWYAHSFIYYTTLHYTTLHYPTLFCIALNRIVTLHTVNCCTEVLQRDV